MNSAPDTIAAIATAAGQGGIGILRLSGPDSLAIAQRICGKDLQPRHAHFCRFTRQGEVIDSGVCLYFPGPASFTGEDVVELQAHGGPVILDMLLRELCREGARLARPGEFSERAFLNDKIDLAQAEAIADLISSSTEAAALSATRSLEGAFSRRVEELVSAVTELRVYIEAAIDFPEEEIDFLAEGRVCEQLDAIAAHFDRVFDQARQGSLLRDGMKIVIAGKPNAGKSSLLNALSGQDSAIVTPIEGTTRDVLREHIEIDGMPLHIVDTAGLRNSADAIEQEGIRRAWREIESADRVLLVVDDSQDTAGQPGNAEDGWSPQGEDGARDVPVTVIHNKCDLSGRPARIVAGDDGAAIYLSARTGSGMDLLREHLKSCMGLGEDPSGCFSARRRHLQALAEAKDFLQQGRQQLADTGAGELLAEDLRQCQNRLGEITGAVTSDDLLGQIFSSFCIGK